MKGHGYFTQCLMKALPISFIMKVSSIQKVLQFFEDIYYKEYKGGTEYDCNKKGCSCIKELYWR